MRPVRLLFVALAALASLLLPAAPAAALSYPVTSTADIDSKGTLRGSIKEANAHVGADTIPIEVMGTIELQSALPIIFDSVTIVGPGAAQLTVKRSSENDFRVLHFTSDASTVSGLTVADGRAEFGGGILNTFGSLVLDEVVVKDSEAVVEGGTEANAEGGGIYSEGPVTLRETAVTGNAARASGGSSLTKALGGGVTVHELLTVEASTISDNVAEASGDGTASLAQGGGVLTGIAATVSRSTISGNAVEAEGEADQVRAQGGGIQTYEASLTATTLSGNSAVSAGLALGANLKSVESTSVRNSIVAEPLGEAASCDGTVSGEVDTISSGGFNLDEDGSCFFDQGSDLNGVPAGLDPVLQDNGGPTPTHALLSGSIAIDRGNSFGSSVDQRGLPRPSDFPAISNKEGGDGSDIGAFEAQVPPDAVNLPAAPILVGTEPGDTTPPRTRIVSGPARVGFERLAKFRFTSNEAQSRFRCKLDQKPWRRCRSPYKVKVAPGKHLFKVRAIDRFGNADPTPARFSWRVKPLS